jgi:hypothetical protein
LPFSEDEIAALTLALSEERLTYWKKLATHNNLAAWRARTGCRLPVSTEFAILLHEWNATLSFCLLASVQILEVSLRNHMNEALSAYFRSSTWWGVETNGTWRASSRVRGQQAEDIDSAIRVAARRTKGITPGGVISELSFGFWLAIIGPAYDNPADKNLALWRNCLHSVFRGASGIDRKQVYERLERIIKLRNRCAHHEPVVQLPLAVEYEEIVRFARLFCHSTADWIERTSLVPHLLRTDWLNVIKTSGRLIGSV